MEVILKQDIAGLGKAGSGVKVKDGFARNFLIPNSLAVPMTAENIRKVEAQQEKQKLQVEKAKREAQSLKDKLANFSLTMPVLVHEDEKLYGSISAADLARSLGEEGLAVDVAMISLDEPIKTLGIYEVPVTLHPEISATVKVWVVKK
jgi:large subunit ribosomal protein L9